MFDSTALGKMFLSTAYFCFCDSMSGQLDDGEISTPDGPLDLVEPDPQRGR